MEGRAALRIVLTPQPAAMRTHNRTANREAKSEPLVLGGEKRLENALFDAIRKSDARVRDHDLDVFVIDRCDIYPQASLSHWFASHRFAAIHDQVQQYLEQLDRIAVHLRYARDLCLHVDA